MKKIIFAIAFMSVAHIGFAQNDAFKKDVLTLIEFTGDQESQLSLMKKQLAQFIPEAKLPALMEEIKKELPKLNNKVADIYMKHYTQEDVKELIAFYKTPLGQKLAKQTKVITPEVLEASNQWGTELQPIMMKYMQ